MQLFKRNISPHELILFAVEIVLICGAMTLALHLHGPGDEGLPWRVLPAAALCMLCLYYNDFYDLSLVNSGRELLARLVQAAGAASILLALIYLAVPFLAVRGEPYLQALAIVLVAIPAGRALFAHVAPASLLVDPMVILGTNHASREVARALLSRPDPAYHLVGYVDDRPEPRAHPGLAARARQPARPGGDRGRPPDPLDRGRLRRPPLAGADQRAGAVEALRHQGRGRLRRPTSA